MFNIKLVVFNSLENNNSGEDSSSADATSGFWTLFYISGNVLNAFKLSDKIT